jgi:hypothetical protein
MVVSPCWGHILSLQCEICLAERGSSNSNLVKAGCFLAVNGVGRISDIVA